MKPKKGCDEETLRILKSNIERILSDNEQNLRTLEFNNYPTDTTRGMCFGLKRVIEIIEEKTLKNEKEIYCQSLKCPKCYSDMQSATTSGWHILLRENDCVEFMCITCNYFFELNICNEDFKKMLKLIETHYAGASQSQFETHYKYASHREN